MNRLRLSDFRELIAVMPTQHQSFTAKQKTKNWDAIRHRQDRAGEAMRRIFGKRSSVEMSRADLRAFAAKARLDDFVMATLLWGYPNGMRGNLAAGISDNLCELTNLLCKARKGIPDWTGHFKHVKRMGGVGLSTYTKFLNFLPVEVSGHTALILDKRIIEVAASHVFEDFVGNFTWQNYPEYLSQMHSVATNLKVDAESLEFFLFEFGRNLKGTLISTPQ